LIGLQFRQQTIGAGEDRRARPKRRRGRQRMPQVIEVVQGIDDAEPWIVRVAMGLVESPAFSAPGKAPHLIEKGPAVPAVVGEAGVTHLVNQYAPLGL
jgi:hypothetical protein